MKTIITVSIALMMLFMGSNCDNKDCHKTVSIVNTTDKDIYVIYNRDYPDTLSIQHDSSPVPDAYYTKVLANASSDQPVWSRSCWENSFVSEELLPSGILMVYTFDATTVENTPWETVTNDYMVLKRYDLSLQDLRNMNWVITYP